MHKIYKSTKLQTTGQKIPTILNGQTQDTDNVKLTTSNKKNNLQTQTTNRVNKLKGHSKCSKHASQKRHKVVILGDSHARGCAARVKHLLNSDFEVFGSINPYPTAFPYGNGMFLHFYQKQESSTTKTVYKVINRGLKAYV
jgi:hypothetical protein